MQVVLHTILTLIAASIRRSKWSVHASRLAAALLFCAAVAIVITIAAPVSWASDNIHMVTPGESLASIASRYQVSLASLSAYNDINNPNLIQIGQKLIIPPVEADAANTTPANRDELPGEKGYHAVVRGESLSSIARTYDMALADLIRLNGFNDSNHLLVGQKLRLTARVTPVAAAEKPDLKVAQTIYVVQEGESLAEIARAHATTVEQLLRSNGLPHAGVIWAGQRLRIQPPPPKNLSLGVAGAPAHGRRWIEIDLSEQRLTAWQGDIAVLNTLVSTGKAETPTVTGSFAINTKLESQRMTGDDYDLPGVPWVMYFYQGYAIHGAYWHINFGVPVTHGCVNMRIDEAQSLYEWASLDTEVVVQE
jgi:LysM repeat protein